ncbi:MAG: 4-demethylwyosine synthase TYW1 [archaeon]
MAIPKKLIDNYRKQHYYIIGRNEHSAVKTCLWTRHSLRGKGVCYKQKFYGINSHRCIQMTPSLFWCDNRCIFCWRNIESTLKQPMNKFKLDSPEEIVEESIKAQRILLSGFPGHENLDKKKFQEALNPNQVAISLSGEPTLYPKIGELIQAYKSNGFTTFLVTNGMHPKVLEKISLPTQLYISLEAFDESSHKKINSPIIKNSWNKFNQSLELFPSLKTRRTIRLTLVKNLNMKEENKFAELISKAKPHFIEVKAFMPVGFARRRLPYSSMPSHAEVMDFTERVNNYLNYKLIDESPESRVALLWNKKKELKIKKK